MTDSGIPPKGLRVIFAGTPDFAAASLSALINSHHTVCAVFTQPDRQSGRGRKLSFSPVKLLAEEHKIPLYQPKTLKSEEIQLELATLNADVMVVAAYGLLLPKAVLSIPPLGCINIHASLLPRWRGAAPIQRAILAGDKTTGITFMQMDEGLDTGNMLKKVQCPIDADETGGSLHDKLTALGADNISKILDGLSDGSLDGEVQDENRACYAPKLTKEEALINWNDEADKLERMVRAFNPWPVTYTTINTGKQMENLRIWQAKTVPQDSIKTIQTNKDPDRDTMQPGTIVESNKKGMVVATGKGFLTLTRLQLPGSKALNAEQILNAKKALFEAGIKLGNPN